MSGVFCNLEEAEAGYPPMCDMTFEVTSQAFDAAQSERTFTVSALSERFGVLGFSASIPLSGWDLHVDGEDEDAFHAYWGTATVRSIGVESDRLVRLLAAYYTLDTTGADSAKLRMAPEIKCLAVGIHSNPALIDEKPVHMKLFFDQGLENGRYAEVFLKIDLLSGVVQLNEKDESYREDLVAWLSRPGSTVATPFLDQGGNIW